MDVAHKVCLPMNTMIKVMYCPLTIAFLDPSALVPLEHSEAEGADPCEFKHPGLHSEALSQNKV